MRIVQQVTPEKRRRLQLELALAARPGTDAATILRTTPPLDAGVMDAMERAIEEACVRTPALRSSLVLVTGCLSIGVGRAYLPQPVPLSALT